MSTNGLSLFRKANPKADSRVVASVWGEPKTGKSHLALTFPPPIYYLNIDFGLEELLPQFPGLDLYRADFQLNENSDPAYHKELLDAITSAWSAAVDEAAKAHGTVVLDTATQLWQIVQSVYLAPIKAKGARAAEAKLAAAGKTAEIDPEDVRVMPFQYGKANQFMGGFLRKPLHYPGLNALYIHRCKEVYNAKGEPTGTYAFQGFGETSAIAQVTLHLKKDKGKRLAFVECNRFDGSTEGLEVPDLDYAMLKDLCGLT